MQAEGFSVSLTGRADVLEPAGDEQAAVEGAEPAFALRLAEGGCDDAGVREPGQRHAPILGGAAVHPAVRQDGGTEAAPRSCAEGSHPASGSVVQVERFYAGDLVQPPDPPAQLPSCHEPAKKVDANLRLHPPYPTWSPQVEYPYPEKRDSGGVL